MAASLPGWADRGQTPGQTPFFVGSEVIIHPTGIWGQSPALTLVSKVLNSLKNKAEKGVRSHRQSNNNLVSEHALTPALTLAAVAAP